MKEMVDKDGNIAQCTCRECTWDEEMKPLIRAESCLEWRWRMRTPQNRDSVVLFSGDELVVSCVVSDFLGVPTWAVEFEVIGKKIQAQAS